ncbi:MAG: hypothetical protein IRZ16_16375 [Myxococcaceae bacterium]|nr:hypothetical protein [Myxococcaceae bacterium]
MRFLAWCALAAGVLSASSALADPYDFRVYKLQNPSTNARANAQFRAFTREFAAALTSVNLSPPETLGHAAFAINAELSVVQFDQDVVQFPTERFVAPDPADPSSGRTGFDGALLIPSLHVRKGLPWSFELGLRAAWIEKSRMAAGTGEVKWAINEGFTYLPDLGVRGYVTRLFNTKDFDLTAAGLDIGLGKQFAIGGMVTLTPYVGWNLVWVAASSNSVDFNPGRSYPESVASPNAQFDQTNVFDEVGIGANSHSRYYGGLRFIGGALQLGAEFSYSQLPTLHNVPTGEGDATADLQLPNVMAFNVTVGLDY